MANVFSVTVFFILFRESLEASIIVSVLLAFAKTGLGGYNDKTLYKRVIWQIWVGAAAGIFICLCIGGGFIGAFYSLGHDIWAASEDLWEGIFSVIATIMITMMGLAMLRLNKMKEKWRVKIARAILDSDKVAGKREWLPLRRWSRKYAMAILPFVTTLREGVEAIVFVGGVSLGTPATAFPLAVICGLLCGCGIGVAIYIGGNMVAIQYFLIFSTCFLYLISAGLFSRAVWYFQYHVFSRKAGGDPAELGSGPGSYDVSEIVWHVNCCNPETDGGWEIFNALFGWQNSATYGSVISYNIYWIFIICLVLGMLYSEKHGSLPFLSKLNFKKKKELTTEEQEDIVRRAQDHYATKMSEPKTVDISREDTIELTNSSSNSINAEKEATKINAKADTASEGTGSSKNEHATAV